MRRRKGMTLPSDTADATRPAPQLPHERDESIDPAQRGAPRPVVRQAKVDVDAGRVDTDNYTRVSSNAAPVLDAPSSSTRRRSGR